MKVRALFCFVIFICCTIFASAQQTANSVSQYGITWFFDKEYTIGQFVNGDYYVVDDGDGVQVLRVTPEFDGNQNGSMVNPKVGYVNNEDPASSGYQYHKQGYSRTKSDNNTADVLSLTWNPDVRQTFPCTLNPGDSLVSTIGRQTADERNWANLAISNAAVIKTAAVLTVLSSVPPEDAFRPPFVDSEKTIYQFNNARLDLLPHVPLPEATAYFNGRINIEYYERGLQRPWLNHLQGWLSGDFHPYDNMNSYHRDVGLFINEASLVLLTDQLSNNQLLINYLQVGIDYYHMVTAGYGCSCFFPWLILFTGIILDEPIIYNVLLEERNMYPPRDYDKFYYWEDRTSDTISQIIPEGRTWTGANVFFRKGHGNAEHEHLDPTEWEELVTSDYPYKNENYRHCCDSSPHVGGVLSAIILKNYTGIDTHQLWNRPSTFDYIDRWMTEDVEDDLERLKEVFNLTSISNGSKNAGSAFMNAMWDTYRGEIIPFKPLEQTEETNTGETGRKPKNLRIKY